MKKIDGGINTTHYFIYQHSRDHSNEYEKHLIPALLQFAAFCFKNYPCLSIGIDLVDSSTHGSKIFWLVKKNIPSLKLTATLPLIVFWQKDFQAFPFGFRPHFFVFFLLLVLGRERSFQPACVTLLWRVESNIHPVAMLDPIDIG